jgi:type IV pilus assembly protein PilO
MVAIKNNIDKYRREYEQVQQSFYQALQQLPDTKDIPNLLRNVSNLGTETMLKVRYFEPKQLQTREFFSELPFELRYSGPFHNIAYFFDGVRRLERIVNISAFSLELPARANPARPVIEGQCTARTYVYVKERPKGKKDEKKDGKSVKAAN